MTDDPGSQEVRSGDEDRAEEVLVIPTIPSPAMGAVAVGGQLGAAAGGQVQPVGGLAPIPGAAQSVAGAQDEAGVFEDADSRTARRVEEALVYDGRLRSVDVAVAVEDGTVEITGSVPSERERQLAGEICAGVSGVRAVRNRLVAAG